MLSKPDKNNKLFHNTFDNFVLATIILEQEYENGVCNNSPFPQIFCKKKGKGEERGILGLFNKQDTISTIVYIDSNLQKKIVPICRIFDKFL